jgi:cytoskeletal protein RodZ
MHPGMIKGAMNNTTNLFVLLIVILFIFPATAIRYAQAVTENSQESSDTGNGQENSSSSTGNEQQQSSSSTENSQQSNNTGNEQQQSNNAGNAQEMPGASTANATTSPSASTASNSTGNMSRADFVNGMLAVHNRERAAFGSPPLVWSDKLAAESKVWAEHVETTGHMVHAPLPACCEGEGIAGYWAPVGPLTPGNGVYVWVDEKKSYHDHEPLICCMNSLIP